MPLIPPGSLSPASQPETGAVATELPPAAFLAPKIDPLTGEYLSVFEGRPLADAFVIEALTVERGTGAAVRDLGHRFRQITHVERSSVELVESMVAEAFSHAEQAGVARLTRVAVEVDAVDRSQISAVVEFRDLLAPTDTTNRRLVFPL